MSTFSTLNTAWTGLTAARRGIDVAGQNVANANTGGYTRQRVDLAAIAAASGTGLLRSSTPSPGLGVAVSGVTRMGDQWLDARVHGTASAAGHWAVQTEALARIESNFAEPGEHGISARLQSFWSAWADLGNRVGDAAPAEALLAAAGALTASIADGYRASTGQWVELRGRTEAMVTEVNDAAEQIAGLNALVRQANAEGRSPNELIDQRAAMVARVAELTGSTVRTEADGTLTVLVEGNPLVAGDHASPIAISGDHTFRGTPVSLHWVRSGSPVHPEGGELSGALAALAPSAAGAGGIIAETAAAYEELAMTLAAQVNALHQSGASTTGATGLDFFAFGAGSPATAIHVVPTDLSGLATAAVGAGALDASIADAIAALRHSSTGPDQQWSSVVTGTAVAARAANQHATLAGLAATSAITAQRSLGAVDLDEETVNLMTHQTAYQAAARVMTAVDELLDTLINRTGVVGR